MLFNRYNYLCPVCVRYVVYRYTDNRSQKGCIGICCSLHGGSLLNESITPCQGLYWRRAKRRVHADANEASRVLQ